MAKMNSLPPNFKFNFDKYQFDFKELSLKGSQENSSLRLDSMRLDADGVRERAASVGDQSLTGVRITNGIQPGSQIVGTSIGPHTGAHNGLQSASHAANARLAAQ